MLQKIEDINLLKLMKDIKNMIAEDKLEFENEDYKIRISKSDSSIELEPLKKLLDLMVKDNYLVTEVYFESEEDFEKSFGIKYDNKVNESIHSIRIEEIKVEHEDTYNGTFIYHESYGGKMKFELDCIKYLQQVPETDYLGIGLVVPVMKYWEYSDEELIEKKMYPLIPLQLFKIRKDLEYACKHNDKNRINELSQEARKLAIKLANESKELFEQENKS